MPTEIGRSRVCCVQDDVCVAGPCSRGQRKNGLASHNGPMSGCHMLCEGCLWGFGDSGAARVGHIAVRLSGHQYYTLHPDHQILWITKDRWLQSIELVSLYFATVFSNPFKIAAKYKLNES